MHEKCEQKIIQENNLIQRRYSLYIQHCSDVISETFTGFAFPLTIRSEICLVFLWCVCDLFLIFELKKFNKGTYMQRLGSSVYLMCELLYNNYKNE